jgi:hypothetical protein
MITLKSILAEAITINGVRLQPKSSTGGPIIATWDGQTATYRVRVKTMFYTGPVAVTGIWQTRAGEYKIADNTGKTWPIDRTDIASIVRRIQSDSARITISKTAADITLDRIA